MPRRRSGKKIDFVHWSSFSALFSGFSAGTSAVLTVIAQHLPETIMRTRGEALVYADATGGPGGLALISIGMILVPEGTGSTVLWSPFTDADAPWFYYDVFHIGYEEKVVDNIGVQGAMASRKVIDSKAMRIVKNSEVQVVVENTSLIGSESVNVAIAGRILAGT